MSRLNDSRSKLAQVDEGEGDTALATPTRDSIIVSHKQEIEKGEINDKDGSFRKFYISIHDSSSAADGTSCAAAFQLLIFIEFST